MARVPIAIQTADRDGLTPVLTTIGADGVSVSHEAAPYIYVVNDSGGAVALVAVANFAEDGLTMPNFSQSIANGVGTTGAGLIFKPFSSPIFRQSTGLLHINGVGLKVAAFK